MKDIINYYYNLDIEKIIEEEKYSSFVFNGEDFYFVFFNRSEEELRDLVQIVNELKSKGLKVHDFILNKDSNIITIVGDKKYVLLKTNNKSDEIISFDVVINNNNKLLLNEKDSPLYRNNWGELWSKKIDYFEYQIKEIGKDKKIVLDSFSYYIGLAENAISYVNKANKMRYSHNKERITLSHRRLFFPNYSLNYYNPLSFIFDLDIRDIAEYIKREFFYGEDSLFDLKMYLKQIKLTYYSYNMLYARLLYPSYYFDIYEDIMNNNSKEEKLLKIIDKVDEYELFLKNAYLEISKYANIQKIDWIMKKQS